MMIQKEKLLNDLQKIAAHNKEVDRTFAKALFYIIKKVDKR